MRYVRAIASDSSRPRRAIAASIPGVLEVQVVRQRVLGPPVETGDGSAEKGVDDGFRVFVEDYEVSPEHLGLVGGARVDEEPCAGAEGGID